MSLSKILSEKNLVGLEVISGKYVDKIDKTGFTSSSFPLSVAGIGCHGKFLYIIFKNKSSLWFTMGISGSLSETRSEHSRIRFYFEDTDIFFSDKNNIGTVKYVENKDRLIQKLQSLGPDILSDDFTQHSFIERIKSQKNKPISLIITDQKVISGIGQRIKSEALWLSKISPNSNISEISDSSLDILYKCIHSISSTLFANKKIKESYFKIYGKTFENDSDTLVYNKSVDVLGNHVTKQKTADGKVSFWVPTIQK
jgi:formamidopyrimidine-DNA glycosylase